MAGSDAEKIDELKRLLRRLDKALPQSLSEAHGSSARAGTAGKSANSTALRTIILAGGVSMVVSLGVAMLLLHDTAGLRIVPVQAPSKDEVRQAPAQQDGSPAGSQRLPTFTGQTATLQAENTLQLQTEPSVARKTPSEIASELLPSARTASTMAAPDPDTRAPPMETGGVEERGPRATVAAASPVVESHTDRAPLVELDAAQFLRRGLLMLSRGSISAAQLLLERAADLGSGDAAFALASTYDGAPGAPRHGPEVRPNEDLALRWYARAQELGVEEARQRLAELESGGAAPGR